MCQLTSFVLSGIAAIARERAIAAKNEIKKIIISKRVFENP